MTNFDWEVARDAVKRKYEFARLIHNSDYDDYIDYDNYIINATNLPEWMPLAVGLTEEHAWLNAFWADDELVGKAVYGHSKGILPYSDWTAARRNEPAIIAFEREHNPNYKERNNAPVPQAADVPNPRVGEGGGSEAVDKTLDKILEEMQKACKVLRENSTWLQNRLDRALADAVTQRGLVWQLEANLGCYKSPCGKPGHFSNVAHGEVPPESGSAFYCKTCWYEEKIAKLTAKVTELKTKCVYGRISPCNKPGHKMVTEAYCLTCWYEEKLGLVGEKDMDV